MLESLSQASGWFDGEISSFPTATVFTFLLILLAEIGDKSQLVCMTLAARYRPWPVLLGASAAFVVLNTVAVLFGALIADFIPEFYLSLAVAIAFLMFAAHSLFSSAEDPDSDGITITSRSLFIATVMLISVAEFGDKTQLAVVALSSTLPVLATWVGASLALILSSAMAIIAGRWLLQHVSMVWVHRASTILFILFAVMAALNAVQIY